MQISNLDKVKQIIQNIHRREKENEAKTAQLETIYAISRNEKTANQNNAHDAEVKRANAEYQDNMMDVVDSWAVNLTPEQQRSQIDTMRRDNPAWKEGNFGGKKSKRRKQKKTKRRRSSKKRRSSRKRRGSRRRR